MVIYAIKEILEIQILGRKQLCHINLTNGNAYRAEEKGTAI